MMLRRRGASACCPLGGSRVLLPVPCPFGPNVATRCALPLFVVGPARDRSGFSSASKNNDNKKKAKVRKPRQKATAPPSAGPTSLGDGKAKAGRKSQQTASSSSSSTTQSSPTAFAYGDGEFNSVYSPTNNGFYVDKTAFIPLLENLRAKAIVSLRPRRFGKTLFANTLGNYYDASNAREFKNLFGHLDIGKQRTPLANSFLVLPLTFSGLKTDTVEKFEMSLNDTLNNAFERFKSCYNLTFAISEQSALSSFERLLTATEKKKEKVYVIIDEYDTSINKALGTAAFASALTNTAKEHNNNPLKRMENTYAEFFSKLKTACDSGAARCFITGVTPLVLAEFTSGFNIARHITDDLRFSLMYGFTEGDVRKGLARVALDKAALDELLRAWKRDHDGYYFHPEASEPLYNPMRILHGLGKLEEIIQTKTLPAGNLTPEQRAKYLLGKIPSDKNSPPSESTLMAIRGTRYAPTVIAKMLAEEGAEINVPGGAEDVFRLSHMHDLAKDPKPLLSFMRYMGALTYAPVAADALEQKHALRIPNETARKEFMKELEGLLNLDATGMNELRRAIDVLVEKEDLGPYCNAVSQYLLSRGNARDIVLGEDPFAQAVCAAMMLVRRNSDTVHKEFEFKETSSASSKRYVDVVYQVMKDRNTLVHSHYLSLKNIAVPGLELSGRKTDWNELCDISRNVVDNKPPEEIVALKLASGYCIRHGLKAGSTVQTVVDRAVKEVQDLYIPNLGSKDATFWVLVRVGLQRILLFKVTEGGVVQELP